jgi:hypothetical protein
MPSLYDRTFEPTEEDLRRAREPSFRMSSAGRRTPIQGPPAPGVPLKERVLGLGEAGATVGSLVGSMVPAGLTALATLPFEGVEGAAKRLQDVSDALTYIPRSEAGRGALEALVGPMEAMSAPTTWAAEAVLRRTGSPLAATVTELALDPFNLLAAPAVPAAARGVKRAAQATGRAAQAAGRELGPKAAEMAEGYMRRSGMMPQAVPSAAQNFDSANINPFGIEPPHDVRDQKKLNNLVESMKSNGWQGRPILAYDIGRGPEALTGSHRIVAARKSGLEEIPVVMVHPDIADYVDDFGRSIVDAAFLEADEAAKYLKRFGDKEAADLMDIEDAAQSAKWEKSESSARNEQRLPQTDTPAFKEFTAGAPVIKADQATKAEFQTGKPVVIEGFSGTRRDFSEIDPAQSSAGYFLSSKPVVADEYAGVYPEGMGGGSFPTGGNIQRSFVRMDNPLFVNARGASFSRIDTRGVPGFGLPMSNTDMLNYWAKQQGYDGVIYKDLRDSVSRPGGQNAPASNVYVSFKPNYVKSAIGNRGTFDVQSRDMTKAQGGAVEGNMGYTQAADTITQRLMDQGMSRDQAFGMALRMADAHMKAGGAVMMAGGGLAKGAARAIARAAEKVGMAKPVTAAKDLTSLEDFHQSLGDRIRQRMADRSETMSAFDYKYNTGQRVFTKDSAAKNKPPYTILSRTLVGNVPMREDMSNPFSRKVIDPETGKTKRTPYEPGYRVRMERGLDDWQEFDIPASAIIGDVEMAGGGLSSIGRGLKRAAEASRDQQTKRAAEAARKAEAARAARTETEKSVVEKFGQKQEQEAVRAAKVQQLAADAPQRDVAPAKRRVKAQPDVYRNMAEQQGEGAVLRAARAGEHLKPTPQGYVGAPRTVTNPQALGAMRRAMDKDFVDSVEAVRLADPERLGTWYDRAKMGIAESSEPYQLPRVLEQHGVYSAGVSPESELGFALKHQNTRALGEPGMAYRGAPMRNLDEAVEQDRAAKMGFKIGEYMNKNDPRVPNAGLFGVNDFRRAQGMGYTDPAGNPWKAGVSETMHPFMDLETALQVDRANRGAVGGRTDWAGPHIQEVPWVYGKAQDLYSRGQKGRFKGDELAGIKRSLVEANNTARDYMYKHAASATHEAVPGASLGHVSRVLDMTPEQKAAYGATGRWDLPAPEVALSDMPGVGAGNRDILYGALGLRQLPSRQGSGLYINSLGGVETNPMTVARPLMDFPTGGGGLMAPLSRNAMDATEAFRALMDAQEAGAFNLPNTMGAVKNKNSLVLDARRRGPRRLEDPSAGALPTAEQLSKMNEELELLHTRRMDVGPLRDPGFGVAPTNRGAVVFPYKGDMDPAEAARALRSVKKDLTKIFPSDPQMSLSTMGYVPGVGKRGQFGPEGTAPYSGEATIDKLRMFADLPPEVALSLGESEAVRSQIRAKALRDAKLGGTRGDIQESRRFFSEADWPRAVEMIRQGMSPAAALAALGYSASSMAGQE